MTDHAAMLDGVKVNSITVPISAVGPTNVIPAQNYNQIITGISAMLTAHATTSAGAAQIVFGTIYIDATATDFRTGFWMITTGGNVVSSRYRELLRPGERLVFPANSALNIGLGIAMAQGAIIYTINMLQNNDV